MGARITHPRRGFPASFCVLGLAGYAFLTGCATDPAPKGSRFVVTSPTAEFYKNGPAQDPSFQTESLRTSLPVQAFGPDAQLPKGASVTMLKREIGYSQVMTDEGAIGYVSNDQLQRAPAITQRAPSFTRAGSTGESRSNRNPRRGRPPQSHPAEEQLDLTDIPLPLPG